MQVKNLNSVDEWSCFCTKPGMHSESPVSNMQGLRCPYLAIYQLISKIKPFADTPSALLPNELAFMKVDRMV